MDVDPLFDARPLNFNGQRNRTHIGRAFDNLLKELTLYAGPHATQTREFELAKIKLEQACFYAVKAMARQEANQVPQESITLRDEPELLQKEEPK